MGDQEKLGKPINGKEVIEWHETEAKILLILRRS